jgi:hypothetical protein
MELEGFVRAFAKVCPLEELRAVVERAVRHGPDQVQLEVSLRTSPDDWTAPKGETHGP